MNKKEERRIIAQKHTEEMDKWFFVETEASVNRSVVFRKFPILDEHNGKVSEMIVDDITSELAVIKYSNEEDTMILNFASYKHPGGGFINGSIAQEEALCHASNLYNIIGDKKFSYEYENNLKNMNNGLYDLFAIYSPNVQFVKGCTFNYSKGCNVLTCPAPNWSAYSKSDEADEDVFNLVLRTRLMFILDIAELMNQKTLILGAFGCGVFGNNPNRVARYFKELLSEKKYTFDKVIFAIPAGENYDAFKTVFK